MNPSYNDSFGSSGSSNGRAPITSSGQDIILKPSASPQKSSRRGLIITGIILIVIAIGFGVGAMLMNTKSQTSENNSGTRMRFNEYANYILYDNNSKSNVVNFDPNEIYYIDDNYEDESFLSNALELYDTFFEYANEDNLEEKTNIDLDRTQAYLDYLAQLSNIVQIDETAVFQRYVSSGEEAASNYVQEYYQTSENENDWVQLHKEYEIMRMGVLMDYWEYYATNNCLIGGEFIDECTEALPVGDIEKLAMSLGRVETELSSLPNTAIKEIKNQCALLARAFNGEYVNIDNSEVEDEE